MFKSKVKRESDQFLINKKLMEKLITKRNMLIERAIEKSTVVTKLLLLLTQLNTMS